MELTAAIGTENFFPTTRAAVSTCTDRLAGGVADG